MGNINLGQESRVRVLMDPEAECRWYAVKTKPHSELRAEKNLVRQDYETFSPRLAKYVRHARKTTMRLAPLFPGYLFVRMNISSQRWTPIESTFGVSNVVKVSDRPAPIKHGLIEELIWRTSETGEIQSLGPQIDVGDEVRVIGGVFDDWIGTVLQLQDKDRVALLLSMMERQVKVTLPRRSVVLSGDPTKPEGQQRVLTKAAR